MRYQSEWSAKQDNVDVISRKTKLRRLLWILIHRPADYEPDRLRIQLSRSEMRRGRIFLRPQDMISLKRVPGDFNLAYELGITL